MREEPPFFIVGIGASAGGLEVLKQFFKRLPADSGLAFVLIQHLDPSHPSLTAELLSHCTAMPVMPAQEGLTVAANQVYVIPPNTSLTLADRVLHLGQPVLQHGIRMPIDHFFRSLAAAQQERAIGIVLSGTGSDGTLGVQAIKAAGGMVMVQTPETAEYQGMPQSAVATGQVDAIRAVEDMPDVLLKYRRHCATPSTPAAESQILETASSLDTVLTLLHTRTHFDFRGYKPGTLWRRLQRRMSIQHCQQLDDYIRLLREHPDEATWLYKDLLIGVTGFFREPEVYQALEQQIILPLLRAAPAEIPLRVWIPGCASGEEAYSIAMLFEEHLQTTRKNGRVQIFASDVDEDALNIARQGVYPENIAADVSPARLQRFFKRQGRVYQIHKGLRETVIFAHHNVLMDPPFSRLDLISCRNLLIYLQPEVQGKLLTLFHFALNPQGYLLLGSAETVGQQTDLFQPLTKRWRLYRRTGITLKQPPGLPLLLPALGQASRRSEAPLRLPPARLADIAHKALLEDYAPAAVLINGKRQILYTHGPIDAYLKRPSGVPSDDLLASVREGLLPRLRLALNQALHTPDRIEIKQVRVAYNDRYHHAKIAIRPVSLPDSDERLWLIAFAALPNPAEPREPARAASDEGDREVLIQRLEQALKATQQELQTVFEEAESSNEDRRAAHEEMMSINEELQSTNEELETSKEELQSLNEELTTLNNQFQNKITELEATSNDLTNLLTSTDIATLFLDRRLRIKRFTPMARTLLPLIAGDVGRPLQDITASFDKAPLLHAAEAVLDDLIPREISLQTEDGRGYLQRVLAYRTEDDRIDGVVVTFVDISERREVEAALRESKEQLQTALEIGQIGLWRWNMSNDYDLLEDTCQRLLGLPKGSERLDHTAWLALVHPHDRESVAAAFNRTREQAIPINLEYRIIRPSDGQVRWLYAKGNRLDDQSEGAGAMLGAILDISEPKQIEASLRQAQKMEAIGQLTGGIAHDFNNLLTIVLGNLQLLEAPLKDQIKLDKYVQTAQQAARQGAELIRQLLAYSRQQALEPRSIDINQRLEGMLALLHRTLGETIAIEIVPGQDLWHALADPHQLETALLNLALNARDAMLQGGALTIETANVSLDAAYTIQEGDFQAGDYVRLAVSDSGSGMPPAVIERAFEPFFTTKATGQGSGLGLSMVYGFAKQSAGHVKLYSEPGRGTTVKLYLPRTAEGGEPVSEQPLSAQPLTGGPETVLAVEDDEGVLELVANFLASLGYTVLEAADGPAALALLEQHPDIDLLFTDIVMPGGMSGVELAREARRRRPNLKVLYTSGYTENTLGHQGQLDEGIVLLNKPYQLGTLAAKVRSVLNGKPESR